MASKRRCKIYRLTILDSGKNAVYSIMLVFFTRLCDGKDNRLQNLFTANSTGHCKKVQKTTE